MRWGAALALVWCGLVPAGQARAQSVWDDPAFALYRQGVEAYNNKDYAAAERLSGEAIQAFPSHVLAYYLQGQAALAQSKWPAAVAAFGKVIELYPASFAGHRELGVAYQELGKTDDAMRAYQAALKIRPEDDELRLRLAVMLQKAGHEDKALPVLQELARRESKIPEVYTTIARLNFESGDFAGAEKAFVKSLSLRDDGWAWLNLGVVRARQNNRLGAMEAFQNAAKHPETKDQATKEIDRLRASARDGRSPTTDQFRPDPTRPPDPVRRP